MMMVDARWASRMMLSYLWKHCISDLLTDLTTGKDFAFSIPSLLAHPSAIFDSASFDGFRRQLCDGLLLCGMLLCHLVMSVGSFASLSFLFNSKSVFLKHCAAGRGGVGGLRVVRAAVLAAALLTPCQALSHALTTQPPQDSPTLAALAPTAGHVLLGSNSSPLIRRLGGDGGAKAEAGGMTVDNSDSVEHKKKRWRLKLAILIGGGATCVMGIIIISFSSAVLEATVGRSRTNMYKLVIGFGGVILGILLLSVSAILDNVYNKRDLLGESKEQEPEVVETRTKDPIVFELDEKLHGHLRNCDLSLYSESSSDVSLSGGDVSSSGRDNN
eukprot:GHVS01068314.1.p1 GENE.GHVS01068314.1~~GHVS01068314.1.p1  ORF type:complete len:329 (-),score=46.40 GHVS01068314.1:64-1050(-)